jgi:hypothetical protein
MTNGNDMKPITPPYLPFKTFLGFLDTMKATAVPQRIDNSILGRFSGTLKTQLRGALRFYEMIDDAGVVTERMRILVAARGTPQWQNQYSDTILHAYNKIIGDLDLDTGTLQQLKECFRAAGVEGSVLIKSVRFYLSALDDSGLTYSPHFKARMLSTGVRSTPRAKPKSVAQSEGAAAEAGKGYDVREEAPKGMQRFALPLKGRSDAVIVVPNDMKDSEWQMIDAYVRMYFSFTTGTKTNSGPSA